MEKQFESHIRNYFSDLSQQHILVANSSGVDSMVLCALLQHVGISFSIAYAHFQLRAAADAEQDFLQDWAANNAIVFHTQKFDTAARAQQEKQSIQVMARQLRYAWFKELCRTHGYTRVLTAHHLNDQLETYLMHSFRTTGPEGLKGIPARNGRINRPLLPFTKQQIRSYAQTKKLLWKEDASNATDAYQRNRIRHHIVPVLEKEYPSLYANFRQTIQYITEQQNFVKEQMDQWKKEYWKSTGPSIQVSLEALNEAASPTFLLHQLFASYGFDTGEVAKLLKASSGKTMYSKTHRLNKERHYLELISRASENIPRPLVLHSWEDFSNPKLPIRLGTQKKEGLSNKQAYLHPETIQFPLLWRTQMEGDYIHLTGMQGRKKISKYFKDEKYSQQEKATQWLLCQGSEVIWIVGKRCNRKFVCPVESPAGVLLTFAP